MYLSNNQRKLHHHVKLTKHWKIVFKQSIPIHDLAQAFMDVESFNEFLDRVENAVTNYINNKYYWAWVYDGNLEDKISLCGEYQQFVLEKIRGNDHGVNE